MQRSMRFNAERRMSYNRYNTVWYATDDFTSLWKWRWILMLFFFFGKGTTCEFSCLFPYHCYDWRWFYNFNTAPLACMVYTVPLHAGTQGLYCITSDIMIDKRGPKLSYLSYVLYKRERIWTLLLEKIKVFRNDKIALSAARGRSRSRVNNELITWNKTALQAVYQNYIQHIIMTHAHVTNTYMKLIHCHW